MSSRKLARPLSAALAVLALGCGAPEDPPGRSADRVRPDPALRLPGSTSPEAPPDDAPRKEAFEPGKGFKISSIAMRTWIYVSPAERSTKLGYLRAGAVVDRGERSVGTEGCAGGWYRVVPRGYVCVGKGASLDIDHQVVQAAVRGPKRGEPLPYAYVTSGSPPPNLYFKLPTRKDQERTEGATLPAHLAKGGGVQFVDLPADAVPDFLASGHDLPKPYGAAAQLHYSVHAGKAKEATVFGLVTTFDWTGRRFGLTTELDMIPLDRTKRAHPSGFHGVVVDLHGAGSAARPGDAPGTPAIVVHRGVRGLEMTEGGQLRDKQDVDYRSGWVLTGKKSSNDGALVETTKGIWLPSEALLIAEYKDDPLGFAEAGKKWIDVNIRKQMLVAYEGKKAAFATLVSSGIGAMGDPETTHATVRGTFLIHAKHVSATMDGDEATDNYDLRDVPYIQYFHEGYALHGAFWHDDFGKPRSHGCVNLAPADAAWLFEWTDPQVPMEWHGAVSASGGTLVWTHG